MKKITSLLLCAVLVLGAASFAFADETNVPLADIPLLGEPIIGLSIEPQGEVQAPYGVPADGINMLDKYEDVEPDSWYFDALYYCEQYSILDPTTDTTMSPDGTIDRKEVVSMLYRVEGAPAFMNDNVFSDVEPGDLYGNAIVWANGKGIVFGYDGLFRPDDCITRQELATIIYRYAQYKGEGFTGDWMFPLPFADAADISDWANEAVHWCYMKNIVNGSDGKFLPKELSLRAEAACMVQRTAKPGFEAPAHVDPAPINIDPAIIEPAIVGGWSINDEFGEVEIPAEAMAAFDKAMEGFDGVGYTPVAYLGDQLVAGMNYGFLCKAQTVTLNPKTSLKVVIVYEDFGGNAEIRDIYDVDVASFRSAEPYQSPEDGMLGGWNFTTAAGGALDERAQEAFDKAIEDIDGAAYTALAKLGSQVVAGTNYAILCKVSSVTAQPKTGVAVMVIYYDLSGNASITNLAQFVF